MGNEHHCRGEKPKNQTQGRAPKKGSDSTRRSHDSGSTSGQTDDRTPQRRHNITSKSELVTKNVDNIDDEGYLLHEAKRRRKTAPTVPPCCTCTRSSTCSTTVGRAGADGCDCKRAGRKCRVNGCGCKERCRNQTTALPLLLNDTGTIKEYFKSSDGCREIQSPQPPPLQQPAHWLLQHNRRTSLKTLLVFVPQLAPPHRQRTTQSLRCQVRSRQQSLRH
jgi:hypothetical protein